MSSRPQRRTGRSGRRPAIADQAEDRIRAGRALKYRASRSDDPAERRALFAAAAAEYAAAAHLGARPSTYALINAAALHLLAGDRAQAGAEAQAVLDLLASGAHAADTPYWLAATRAEAELVMGDLRAAEAALAEAVALAPRAWEDHAITLRQFRLLLHESGGDTDWLDRFAPPPVLAFGGTMGLSTSDEAARAMLARSVAEIGPAEGHGALAAGTDIVVAEALLALGAELHVVLPADPARFREASVVAVEMAWGARFDACLARAASVEVIAGDAPLDAGTSALAARVAMGRAIGRAKDMATQAIGLRATAPGGNAEIVQAWAAWAASGLECRTVALERSAAFAGFATRGEPPLRTQFALAGGDTAQAFPNIAAALAEARRRPGAPIGLDLQVGDGEPAGLARAAARAGDEPGLWASGEALALARLAEPDIDAELAGAVGHARGTSDLYRVYLR